MAASQTSVSGPARPSNVVPVPLAALVEVLGASVTGPADTSVTGISLSSGTVVAGDLYAALPGERTHGARFAVAAIEAGAGAVLTDPDGAAQLGEVPVPVAVVEHPRSQLGRVAALIYAEPAAALTLIGVTGTHGKTTTTQLIAAGAAAAGRRSAVIGTMGSRIGDTPVGGSLTTPEAPDLHALFAVMREQGVEVCAMEVSSHALVLGRVDGVVFDLAVFTNLGRDHLDFHSTMEEYFAAKASLFTPERARRALVDIDDEHGARLLDAARIPTRSLSTAGRVADWTGTVTSSGGSGSGFDVVGPRGARATGSVALAGRFNVANAVCAVAALTEVGCDLTAAAAGVAGVRAVAGRMEPVDEGQPFSVIVDYAHKPDAVTAALEALRAVTSGRLVIVIGAGGDRDRGKRPLMGEVSARLADLVVVTDDNPRREDPASIRAEVVAGAEQGQAAGQVLEIADRGEAIRYALTAAREGDVVLIAGKGHETGQEIDGQVHPFDDRETARRVLREIASTGALA